MLLASQKISSFSEILDQYKVFVFDLCGVLHNGVESYQQTFDFIKQLRENKKRIIFLSNSPSSQIRAINHLKKSGLDLLPEEELHTSGSYFISLYERDKTLQAKKYYFYGKDYNREFLLENNLNLVSDPKDSDVLICSEFCEDQEEVERVATYTKSLLKYNLPFFCINPDIYAPHGKNLRYTPGYFAKVYADSGGVVKYFGKPESAIYKYILDKIISQNNINKKQIIMIGDSMNTDVRGAQNYQINSLLVGNGYHQNIDFEDFGKLKSLFHEYGFAPNYYINRPQF